jgi:hypothetical protein
MKLESRVKEIGKKCLVGLAAIAVIGTMGAAGRCVYRNIQAEIATYSPEFLECSQKCSDQYRYELRKLREVMEEHDCSADWWEQNRTTSYYGYESCRESCDKLKWPKK